MRYPFYYPDASLMETGNDAFNKLLVKSATSVLLLSKLCTLNKNDIHVKELNNNGTYYKILFDLMWHCQASDYVMHCV